ncbi:tyrosine-type recombinase/integrase [Bordetella avium]|uniref:tyrosine-type recombinase/integrase n=1 Tax=Bordetella avium TaxID=521 RepID=UPI000FDBE6FF|nr:site-specific integrase [Bordetella avium]AZY52798.1 integrase [Bordetella avium]
MSIRKDKTSGIYQISISPPGGGTRIRCSAGTTDRKAAQEYHDRLKADLWRQAKLGEMPDKDFEDAAVRFLRETVGQRDYATKQRHVAFWREKFAGRSIRSLTSDDIVDALPTHRIHQKKAPTPLTGATLNRYLSTIRRMLNLCVDWDWLDKAPKLPVYYEPDVRVRWEPPEVIAALIDAMTMPWMQDAALVAVMTGMRESEQFGLRPRQVDLSLRATHVTSDNAKSGRARSVPLNDAAYDVLERRLKTATNWVFTRDNGEGVRIQEHDKRIFNRACKAVGIEDFHWHDLRHTWASWHVQGVMNGVSTPLMVLKELGGWETIQMVQKYAHLAPSHLADYAGNVKIWSMSGGQEKTPLARVA